MPRDYDKMKFEYCLLGTVWGPWEKDDRGNKGGFIVQYGIPGFGFGEVTICIHKDGTLHCDAETCPREFVQRVLKELTLRMFIDGNCGAADTDPEVIEKYKHGARDDGIDEAFDAANEEKEPGETAVVIAPETLVENEAMKPFLEKLSKKMTDPEGKGYSVNVDVIPPTGNN